MITSVEVALFGPSWFEMHGDDRGWRAPPLAAYGPGVPWDARPRATVEVSQDTTLAQVLDRAASRLGVSFDIRAVTTDELHTVSTALAGVAFEQPDPDGGVEPGEWKNYWVGVDEDGLLLWGDVSRIRIRDLERAAADGLYSFDVSRVYLWPVSPQGGEIFLASWDEIERVAKATLAALDNLQIVLGAGGWLVVFERKLNVLRRLGDVKAKLVPRLCGATQLQELFESKEWRPPELARRLGLEEADVEGLAVGLGATPAEGEGRTLQGDDLAGALAERVVREVFQNAHGASDPDFPPDHVERIARSISDLVARGLKESRVPADQDWAAAITHELAQSEAHRAAQWGPTVGWAGLEEPPEIDGSFQEFHEFSVRTITTEGGLDVEDLRAALEALGRQGFAISKILRDVQLADGATAMLVIGDRLVFPESAGGIE